MPQPAEIQPELIEDDPKAPRSRRLDPKWKPPWEVWRTKWGPWRRITNDFRVPDSGHRLWHWFNDCKDKYGRVEGDRVQAWFLVQKFRWSRETIYRLIATLAEFGYITVRKVQGCLPVIKVQYGEQELPPNASQLEWPFVLPASSGCQSKPTPDRPGCQSKPTSGVSLEDSGCQSKPTPYSTNCVPRIVNQSVRLEREEDSLPPGFPRMEEEAIKGLADLPCSDFFISLTWHKAMSRGGLDWQGKPITAWRKHVEVCWVYERMREPQRAQQYTRKRQEETKQRRAATAATESVAPDPLGPQPGDANYGDWKKTTL